MDFPYNFLTEKLQKICIAFVVCFFMVGFGSSAFANSGVEMVFSECVSEQVCQRISTENTTNTLSASLQKGEKMRISIEVLNPIQKEVYSVESWIKFDPQVFSVTDLSEKTSDFPLSAPGEFTVDEVNGIIKIGRAITGAPVISTESTVASFVITAKKNTINSTLSFIDYRLSDVGKTSVLTIENMVPQNILFTKPKDLLFVQSQSYSAPSSYVNPVQNQQVQNGTNIYGVQNTSIPVQNSGNISQYQNTASQIPSFLEIIRPSGLRTRTYIDGKVEHIWKLGDDVRISGYYLYYSTSSGRYMHRKDVGKTNVFQFPAGFFEKGKRVYFAVQAYDTNGKISDFSDETYVTVGTMNSESHPFFEQIFPNVQLDAEGKAYRTPEGNVVKKENTGNGYAVGGNATAHLSTNFPNQNTQSGNSLHYLFLLLGGALFLFGSRNLLYRDPV